MASDGTQPLGMSVWDRLVEKDSPAVNNIPDHTREKLKTVFPGSGRSEHPGSGGGPIHVGGGQNNGFGNGDQDAPGNSLFNNRAENNQFQGSNQSRGLSASNLFEDLDTLASGESTVFGAVSSTPDTYGALISDPTIGKDPVVFGGTIAGKSGKPVGAGKPDFVGGAKETPISIDPTLVEAADVTASLVEDLSEKDDDDIFKSYKGKA